MELKKEAFIEKFRTLPKRSLSDIEKQMIFIIIEKSKVQRERSIIILNKGFLVFLTLIIVAYLSRIYDLVSQLYINILFIFGVVVLIISMITYYRIILDEEKTLDILLDSFLK